MRRNGLPAGLAVIALAAGLATLEASVSSDVLGRAGAFLPAPRLEQLAAGLSNAPAVFAASPCLYYPVPALSDIMRVPTAIPPDAGVDDRVELSATPDAIEAASFVVYALENFKRVTFTIGELQSPAAVLPASAVDLRVVKCWYQGASAWARHVPRHGWPWVLTPELLLHDETLVDVRVETNRNVSNYIRLDKPEGSEYLWVRTFSPTEKTPAKVPAWAFPEVLPIKDAAAMQPVALKRDEAKQFWITIQVPAQQPAGRYAGRIEIVADGKPLPPIALSLRVLPFTLPPPKTYYDTSRDFVAAFMGGGSPRGARAQEPTPGSRTDEQLLAEYRSRVRHNDLQAHFAGNAHDEAALRKLLRMRKAAGFPTRPLVGLAGTVDGLFFERSSDSPEDVAKQKEKLARLFTIVEEEYGHRDIFVSGCDEAPRWTVRRQAPFWRAVHELGGRVFATGDDAIFRESGNLQDWLDRPGRPSRALAARWHATGSMITMYAAPFAGAESPDLFRRCHGLGLYRNDYDGSSNYTLYEKSGGFVWDDYYPGDYRAFCVVYPTIDGVLETLAWEGYRAALDDVRYATLLKQLAEPALKSGSPALRRLAKRALYELATVDVWTGDLDAFRQKMVGHILALQAPGQPEAR